MLFGHHDLNDGMRRIVVQWMMEVSKKYALLESTLHRAVCLLDAALHACVAQMQICRKTFQLLALACIGISVKIEETNFYITRTDLCYLSAGAYNKEQLVDMEYLVYTSLQWKFSHQTFYSNACDILHEIQLQLGWSISQRHYDELICVSRACLLCSRAATTHPIILSEEIVNKVISNGYATRQRAKNIRLVKHICEKAYAENRL